MHRPRHARQSGAFPAPCVAMLRPRNERRCSASPPRCHAVPNRASPSPRIADQRLAAALLCQAMPSPCHITRRIAFCPAPHSHAFASPRSVSPSIAPASPAHIKASHVRALPSSRIARLCPFRAMLPSAHAAQCHALPCPCRAAFGLALPLPRRHAGLHAPVLCPSHRHAALRTSSALPCPLRRAVPRRARPSHARATRFST